MNSLRKLNRIVFILLLFVPFAFQSCGPDGEVDCNEYLQLQYNTNNCAHCVIKGDNWLTFNFNAIDTTYFPYTGYDTLKYEIRDSLGSLDTVTFIGQGKQYSYRYGNPGTLSSSKCVEILEERQLAIEFIPNKPGYSPLIFNLVAKFATPAYEFLYKGGVFDGLAVDVNDGQVPILNFRGKEFYNVAEYSKSISSGNYKYYVSKDDQLLLITRGDSSHFFRITD